MKRILLLAACAALFAVPASATIFGGNTTNNTTNNQGGQGGAGGRGGDGGTGIGFGGAGGNAAAGAIAGANATAGAAAGAVANNRNSIRNNVSQGQVQGQAQGQQQRSSNRNANAATVNYNEATGMHYSGNYTVRSNPDVNAPAIWANNPCVVSFSGGVSVVGFGASIGAGIEDRDCTRRANAQQLTAMGQPEVAREVMCNSTEVREAFLRAGRPCAVDAPRVQSVSVTPTRPVESAQVLPAAMPVPAPILAVPTNGLSRDACDRLAARGLAVQGC